jgi:hypothetical protein
MIEVFSSPGNRRIALSLVAVGGALSLAAAAVGVSDNPPGLALTVLAAFAVILAVVHPWRSTRQFARLAVGSVVAFVVLVIAHNLLDGIAGLPAVAAVLRTAVEVVSAAAFLGASFLCPPAFVIGAVGALATFARDLRQARRSKHPAV